MHHVVLAEVLITDLDGGTPLKYLMNAGGILYMQNNNKRKILCNTKKI